MCVLLMLLKRLTTETVPVYNAVICRFITQLSLSVHDNVSSLIFLGRSYSLLSVLFDWVGRNENRLGSDLESCQGLSL